MPRLNDPFLGLGYGWNPGENGWGTDGYNEMVFVLALLSSGGVEAIQTTPPAQPNATKAYIVAQNGVADWYQKDNQIAYRYGDTWRFITPRAGMLLLIKNRGVSGEYFRCTTSLTWEKLETGGGGGIPDVKNAGVYVRQENLWALLRNVTRSVAQYLSFDYSIGTNIGLFDTSISSGTTIDDRAIFVDTPSCIEFIAQGISETVGLRIGGVVVDVLATGVRVDGQFISAPNTIRSDSVYMSFYRQSDQWYLSMWNHTRSTGVKGALVIDKQPLKPVFVSKGINVSMANAHIYQLTTDIGGWGVPNSASPGTQDRILTSVQHPIRGVVSPISVTGSAVKTIVSTWARLTNMVSSPCIADSVTISVTPLDNDDRVRAVINGKWVDITDRLNPPRP